MKALYVIFPPKWSKFWVQWQYHDKCWSCLVSAKIPRTEATDDDPVVTAKDLLIKYYIDTEKHAEWSEKHITTIFSKVKTSMQLLLLKCYTPRNELTNQQTAGFEYLSYNIIIIDAYIICCNDVKIHCVLVPQFGERVDQLIVSALMAG